MPSIILFGITGDLARKKLLPSLARLSLSGNLPPTTTYFGFGRKPYTKKELNGFISECLSGGASSSDGIKKVSDDKPVEEFISAWNYICSELDDEIGYKELAKKLSAKTGAKQNPSQPEEILIYISLPPQFHSVVIDKLVQAKVIGKGAEFAHRKLILEKPFGHDEKSAQNLWQQISKQLNPEQVYLVDHYGAKQSIVEFQSFAKTGFFNTLFSKGEIKKIHVKLLEKKPIFGRGVLYDSIGTLKDVGQNHVLRMLTAVLVVSHVELNPNKKRLELSKAEIIRKIKLKRYILGQYKGFTDEDGVKSSSVTETYFKIFGEYGSGKHKIEIILEAGKATGIDDSSISLYLKDKEILTIPVNGYGNIDAYDTVFEAARRSDRTVFADFDEVLASWKFIERITNQTAKSKSKKLKVYPAGDASKLF